MPLVKIPTSFNLDIEFEVSEFYRRFLAWLLDMVLQIVYLLLAYRLLGIIISSSSNPFRPSTFAQIYEILLWFPVIFYYLAFEIFTNGQSIGKKVAGLRVVNENGGKASPSQYVIRWLIRVSDLMMVVAILILATFPSAFQYPELRWALVIILGLMITDLILVASSKKSQRLGDVLAQTIIVRTKNKADIQDTVFREVEESYTPHFPQIMQLSDKDINAIKSILDTAHKNGDFNLAYTATEKIKAHLKIDTSMNPYDFLATALKDYNYLSVK